MKAFRTKHDTEFLEAAIRDIHYRLIRLTKSEFHASGITPPRFHVLHYVAMHGPVDMGELHSHMHVSRSSLTSLVDGLVEESLLARDRSELDRRRVVLTITSAGSELLERMRLSRCRHLGEASSSLSQTSVQNLITALATIRENLEV